MISQLFIQLTFNLNSVISPLISLIKIFKNPKNLILNNCLLIDEKMGPSRLMNYPV